MMFRENYDLRTDGYVCRYTGVRPLEEMGEPWSFNFDHVVPGDDRTFAVAAEWARRMKRGLSERDFWAVVREERRHLRTGRPFRRYVAKFEHWRGNESSAEGRPSRGPSTARAAAGPCSTGTSAR